MAEYLKNVNGNTYSVLEANFLAARRTGQVKAQLPLSEDDTTGLDTAENGMLLVYDMGDEVVRKPDASDSENTQGLMLHFSVEKEYDNIRPGLHNYAVERGKTPYPRLYKLHEGDTFTTDAVKIHATEATADLFNALTIGHIFGVGADGFIDATAQKTSATGVRVKLIAKTTLPDGGYACKFEVEKA